MAARREVFCRKQSLICSVQNKICSKRTVICFIVFGLLVSASAQPQDEEVKLAESGTPCTRDSDSSTLQRVLTVLDGFSEMTTVLQEIRRLEKKVAKMGKALKKLGLLEDQDGEFFDPSTPTPPTTTTTTVAPATPKEAASRCKDGWSQVGEGCYQVVTDRALSWEEARQQCLQQGADLAEMNSISEQRGVTGHLNSWNYGVPFWLAGRRNARGRWRWEWTESRIQSRAVKWGWAEDFPRSQEKFDCLATRGRGELGGLKTWENLDCEEAHNYICEYLWIQEYLTEEVLGQGESRASDKVSKNKVAKDKMARNKVARDKMARKLEENMGLVEGLRKARELRVQTESDE